MVFVAAVKRDIPGHHRCIKDFLGVSESEAVTVVTGQNQLAYHCHGAALQRDRTS